MPEMNLLDKEVILTILSEVDRSEEKDRRKDAFNAYQIYRGNLEPYVKKELQRTRKKSWKSYTYSDISLSGLITDKRGQAYDEEPIRSIDGSKDKTESLDDIYEEGDADDQLQFFDKLYNLNRYAVMWVNYLSSKEKYQFLAMQPYETVLVRDKDDGELLIVGLNYPRREITQDSQTGDGMSNLIAESQSDSGAQNETWVFWSKDQHVKIEYERAQFVDDNGRQQLKRDINYVDIPNNPNSINPLGILPFVYMAEESSPDYPVVNPLTKQTVKFNVQQSETLTSKNIHGTGIQVFKYPEKFQGKFEKIDFGQLSTVELPQSSNPQDSETDFDYKTSGAQLVPMKEIDFGYVEQVAKQHGLENFEIDQGSTNAMNGISRAIAGASVQKIITKNQKKYAKLEKRMFEIIKAWEVYIGGPRFGKDDSLQVAFPKPKVMVSDRETLDNLKLMIELGVIEEWEKLIKLDPNLDETAAKEKLARIKKEKTENAKNILAPKEDKEEDDASDDESINEDGGTESE